MLQFLLVLLGLAFPNSHTTTVSSVDNSNQTTITNNIDGDTGGETGHNPPKK